MKDPVIGFGKFKGMKVSQLPVSYLQWLAVGKHDFGDKVFEIPEEIAEAARERLKYAEYDEKRLAGMKGDKTEYILEAEYNNTYTVKAYLDFESALDAVAKSFTNPNLKNDRILIWEVLPSGHKKLYWRFTGFKWDKKVYTIDQGRLPNHLDSLYDELLSKWKNN